MNSFVATPQLSSESERTVIGALLLDPDGIAKVGGLPLFVIPWHKVGVFKHVGESRRKLKLDAKFIHGKCVRAGQAIVSMSRNMLADK